jgi:predicted PilT family ATPase
LLANTKIVTSFYEAPFSSDLSGDVFSKIAFDGIDAEHMEILKKGTLDNMFTNAAQHSDGIILASESVSDAVAKAVQNSTKPVLDLSKESDPLTAHETFYQTDF